VEKDGRVWEGKIMECNGIGKMRRNGIEKEGKKRGRVLPAHF